MVRPIGLLGAVEAGPDASDAAGGNDAAGGFGDAGEADGSDGGSGCGSAPASFSANIMPIFQQSCSLTSVCHGQMGNGSEENLYLGANTGGTSPSAIHNLLVGVRSVEDPSMNLVTAGDTSTSYLWHKVVGDRNSNAAVASGCAMAVARAKTARPTRRAERVSPTYRPRSSHPTYARWRGGSVRARRTTEFALGAVTAVGTLTTITAAAIARRRCGLFETASTHRRRSAARRPGSRRRRRSAGSPLLRPPRPPGPDPGECETTLGPCPWKRPAPSAPSRETVPGVTEQANISLVQSEQFGSLGQKVAQSNDPP